MGRGAGWAWCLSAGPGPVLPAPSLQTSGVGAAPGEAALGSEANTEGDDRAPSSWGSESLLEGAEASGPASLLTDFTPAWREVSLKERLMCPLFCDF